MEHRHVVMQPNCKAHDGLGQPNHPSGGPSVGRENKHKVHQEHQKVQHVCEGLEELYANVGGLRRSVEKLERLEPSDERGEAENGEVNGELGFGLFFCLNSNITGFVLGRRRGANKLEDSEIGFRSLVLFLRESEEEESLILVWFLADPNPTPVFRTLLWFLGDPNPDPDLRTLVRFLGEAEVLGLRILVLFLGESEELGVVFFLILKAAGW
nr:hypothetical protein PanWU01x14_191370 [Ipomoea batatas]